MVLSKPDSLPDTGIDIIRRMNYEGLDIKQLHRNLRPIAEALVAGESDRAIAGAIAETSLLLGDLLAQREKLAGERNSINASIGKARRNGEDVSRRIKKVRVLSGVMDDLAMQIDDATARLQDLASVGSRARQSAGVPESAPVALPGQFAADRWSRADAGHSRPKAACKICISTQVVPADWDAYVRTHPRATHYHQYAWRDLLDRNFGHESLYLTARTADGTVSGVLAAIHMNSRLFGSFMLSMPFVIYGGVLANDPASDEALVEHLLELAASRGCTHAELRQIHPRQGWLAMPGKVAMILALPDTVDALNSTLGASVRAQVKRAVRENPIIEFGGEALVNEFYSVFCEKMRDLGTPVYHKSFFYDMSRLWQDSMTFVVVRVAGQAVAAACLVEHRDTMEIPWAAARRKYNTSGMNMFMYHAILQEAVHRDRRFFDFGRSDQDSSTYRFKKQWGAQPQALNWQYAMCSGKPAFKSRERSHAVHTANRVWKYLPVSVTRYLGPLIARQLPW